MKRTYKVWIEIEELDAKGEPTGRDLGVLPDSLGAFPSLKKATAKVAEVVAGHGIDPENSDSVRAASKDAPSRARRTGEATVRLILDVRYERNGVGIGRLKGLLDAISDRAARDGLMTGDTAAEVVEWFARVEEVTGRAAGSATCSLCGKPCDAGKAHLHQGRLIGDECCWDERLKASE
jgi:hypothetical protein